MAFLDRISRRKKIIDPTPFAGQQKKSKKVLWILLLLILALPIWFAIKSIVTLQNIVAKNNTDGASFLKFGTDIPADKLTREGDGRINILLIGIGGENHKGGLLADSVLVYSIDPINKTSAIVSIPRDLYVTQPGSTSKSKINAVYANGVENCTLKKTTCQSNVDGGGAAMKQVVDDTLDLPIQYFARVDFKGFESIIDALGGVDVNVEKTLNDPHYPDTKLEGYQPLLIKAGLQKMTGVTALKYARSRQSTSDFDRAHRQQQIIAAARAKALSLNFLTNPKKINEIFNALGSHLKTDLQPDEWKRLFELVGEIKVDASESKVLDTAAGSPLTSVNDPRAGYIIVPKLGLNDFSEVQDYTRSILKEPYLVKENAKIMVNYPASQEKSSLAMITKLKSLGYNIVDQAALTTEPTAVKVELAKDEPYTKSLLEKRYQVKSTKTTKAPAGIDIVLTLTKKSVLK